jgi:hypothetical protein
VLGARWLRRIARATGTDIVHGSAHGSYWHDFTTADHRHGRIHAISREVAMLDACPRFDSCRRLFPGARDAR